MGPGNVVYAPPPANSPNQPNPTPTGPMNSSMMMPMPMAMSASGGPVLLGPQGQPMVYAPGPQPYAGSPPQGSVYLSPGPGPGPGSGPGQGPFGGPVPAPNALGPAGVLRGTNLPPHLLGTQVLATNNTNNLSPAKPASLAEGKPTDVWVDKEVRHSPPRASPLPSPHLLPHHSPPLTSSHLLLPLPSPPPLTSPLLSFSSSFLITSPLISCSCISSSCHFPTHIGPLCCCG